MPTFAQMQELRMNEQRAQAEAIAAERQATFERGVAARAAERGPTDDRVRREKAEQAKAREQGARDRARAAAEDREDELRARFDARFPGGSDADFRLLRPQLLAEFGAEAEAPLSAMRAGGRYSL